MQRRKIELIDQDEDIRSRISPSEYKALEFPVHDGYAHLAARRKFEVLSGSNAFHRHVAGYFPHEARGFLEQFVRQHYNTKPQSGTNTESSIADRNKHHFPYLFKNLRTRVDALLEIAEFSTYRMAFEGLEAEYMLDLSQARNLTRNLAPQRRTKKRNELYRLALSNIFERLVSLLDELCAIGDYMQKYH